MTSFIYYTFPILELMMGNTLDHENYRCSIFHCLYIDAHTYIPLHNYTIPYNTYTVCVMCYQYKNDISAFSSNSKQNTIITLCTLQNWTHSFIGCHPLAVLTVRKLYQYQNKHNEILFVIYNYIFRPNSVHQQVHSYSVRHNVLSMLYRPILS